jgi:hypothetical protein
MTRKTTWTNADGLVVGFGPNFAERNVSGVHDTDGQLKEARLAITWESSGAAVTIPAGSVVMDVIVKVGTAWVGGTKVEVGDGSDADGWISAAQGATANLTAGATLRAGGAYAVGGTDATAKALGKVYASADTLDVTITGSYTAGDADIIVRYV